MDLTPLGSFVNLGTTPIFSLSLNVQCDSISTRPFPARASFYAVCSRRPRECVEDNLLTSGSTARVLVKLEEIAKRLSELIDRMGELTRTELISNASAQPITEKQSRFQSYHSAKRGNTVLNE